MLLTRDQAEALAQRVLGLSSAQDCVVALRGDERRNIRFASRGGGTNGASSAVWLTVTSGFGRRLNPASNLGHIFSTAGLSRLLRSLVPFVAIAALAVNVLRRDFSPIAHAARFDSRAILAHLGALLFELAWKCGLVLLAWSTIVDFCCGNLIYGNWQFGRYKSDEQGNPRAGPLQRK